jgi:antitoxin MazE
MAKEAKLIPIGNSQGIRLPKTMISKYGLGESVVLEEVEAGILIHAPDQGKLSWEDTYKEMALANQDEWSDWQEVDIDLDKHL